MPPPIEPKKTATQADEETASSLVPTLPLHPDFKRSGALLELKLIDGTTVTLHSAEVGDEFVVGVEQVATDGCAKREDSRKEQATYFNRQHVLWMKPVNPEKP